MSENYSKNMSLFICGLGAGAAIGLLFAPKSGEQTRAQIGDALLDAKNKAMEHQDGIRTGFNQTKAQVAKAVDAGREAYRSAVGRTSDEVDRVISST